MAAPPSKPAVWFVRRFRKPLAGSNGGNLKLRDCYDHFAASDKWAPKIVFADDSVWYDDRPNLWSDLREGAESALAPKPGDLLFFSGHDWRALPKKDRWQPPVPVLNIAQPRHTRAADKRRVFLRHPAIRIAKSEKGRKILAEHGVNGPLFTIPDTIDLSRLPPVPEEKDIDVMIPGLKQPEFARAVYDRLQAWNEETNAGLCIHLQLPPKLPKRSQFLELVARSRVLACVPLEAERGGEGFYLPALEGMALGTLIVCPHAIGNVGHCLDGVNCIVPPFTPEGVAAGVQRMLAMAPGERRRLLEAGHTTAENHDIHRERRAVLDLADRAYDLWSQTELFLPSAGSAARASWLAKARRWFAPK